MVEKIFLYLYVISLPFIGLGVFKAFFNVDLGVGVIPAYLIALLLSYVLLIKYLAGKKKTFTVPSSPVNGALLLFLTALVLSSLMSYFVPISEFRGEFPIVKSLKQILFWGFMVFNYFLIISIIKSRKVFKTVLTVHITTALVVSIFGLLQLLNLSLSIPGIDAANKLLDTSESFRASYSNLSFHNYSSQLGRIRSTTPEPLVFSNYLLTVIPFVLASLFCKHKLLFTPRWFNLIVLITTLVAFVLTFSKGGYAALAGGLLIVLAVVRRNRVLLGKLLKYTVVIVVLVLSLYYLFVVSVMGVKTGFQLFISNFAEFGEMLSPGRTESGSIYTRWYSTVAALKMLMYYPVLGVGVGNYVFYYYDFAPPGGQAAQFYLPTANNIFLQVFAESGILGGALLLLVIWFLVKQVMNIPEDDDEKYIIRLAFIFSGSGLIIQMLSASAYTWPHIWFLMALIVVYRNVMCKASV